MMENKEIRIISQEDSEVRIVPNSRKVEGLGIVFNKESKDLGGFTEIILPEAVKGVLERSDVLALLNHDQSRGLLARSTNGKGSLKLDTDKKGVKYAFDAPAFDLGDELIEGIKRGDINSSSFAFSVAKDEWDYKRKPLALRTIVEFDSIYDMSPCYRAAYADTSVALRNLETLREDPIVEPIIEDEIKPVTEEPVIEPIIEEPVVEMIAEPVIEQKHNINLINNSMTITELKDLRAQALEQNEKIFEAKKTENRTMTEKEEAQVAENNQRVKEYDLEIESESRKLGKGLIVGPYIKFSQPEAEPFSLLRAIRAKAEMKEMPAVARDMFTIGKQEFRNSGVTCTGDIVIPFETRAPILAQGGAGTGAEIVAEDKKAILPPLVDTLVFGKLGTTFLTGLVGDVSIPSYSGTTVLWKDEVETAIDGGGTFSEVLLAPKRITGFILVSKTFLEQDGVGAEKLLLSNIANAVARKIESTVLGVEEYEATQPAGMGFVLAAVAEAPPTYASMVGLESQVDAANALAGNLAYLTNAAGRGILKSIDKGTQTDTGHFLCSELNMVNGYPLIVTNSCSGEAGLTGGGELLVFGNWADLVIAHWGGYDITVDPYTAAKTNQVIIVINTYVDAKCLRGTFGTGPSKDDYYKSFARLPIVLA